MAHAASPPLAIELFILLAVAAPTSLQASFMSENCSQVTLTWSPPLDGPSKYFECYNHSHNMYAFSIDFIGYSITLSGGESSKERTLTTGTNSVNLTSLECCTDYSYSVRATPTREGVIAVTVSAVFRTQPNFTGNEKRARKEVCLLGK